jgi:predicted TIM-barrel fold metal-dependent hydrolase
MMQNIHTHTWDQDLHFEKQTVRETDLSRGYRLDLTVQFDAFMADVALFDRVAVFGLKARRTGYWVPDEYVAEFVSHAPDKLVGFAGCDPTQPGYMSELKYAILFHTGTTFNRDAPLGFSRPWLFDEIAIHYPELCMVLAHLGHPFYDECLAVIRKHPHLYADLAALYYRPWQFYNMLILAQEYQVTHKLLFGTDYPFAQAQASIAGLRNANHIIGNSGLPRVSSEVIEDILERDAFSLLGID